MGRHNAISLSALTGFVSVFRLGDRYRCAVPDDSLHLIIEVKGYRHENVKLKSETMRTQWVPRMNNLGTYGRWAFEEFSDVYEMDKEFKELIDRVIAEKTEGEVT